MKKIRMDPEAYQEGSAFSITIATAGRRTVFTGKLAVAACLDSLRLAAKKYDASIYAYCFMPDHLHLLVDVPGDVSLITFIRHFKQLSSYNIRRLPGFGDGPLWQRRFYDHALRSDEQLGRVADYLWDNPVRAGIAEEQAHYPFSGSLAWEIEGFLSGSEDPDLRSPPTTQDQLVGADLETGAANAASSQASVGADLETRAANAASSKASVGAGLQTRAAEDTSSRE